MAPHSFFHGLFFTSILFSISAAAATVLAPNMSSCHLPSLLPPLETPFSCCPPPADYPLRLFTPNFSLSSPLRVRRPAHLVDESYAAKLARAYALMKALPSDDPRSFMQQANIHCAYCNAVYNQMNSSELFQVHGCWLFFPFHRWYLYFHERILARLLGEDDFALPFWNYDHPERASIPWLYSTYNLTLVDSLRDSLHRSPAPAAIDYTWDTDRRSWDRQLRENANAMFRSLIRDATSKENFFGVAYRAGQPFPSGGYGTVEERPHNSVHDWVGQKSQIGWKDMGSLYAGARDPVFYAHHASLDRLWEVWKAMAGNEDIKDEDYLEAEFAFYNEDAELVRVKVGDALETKGLGYRYEEVENVWMEAIPERRSAGAVKLIGNESMCVEGEAMKAACLIVMERERERERERDAEGAEGARGKEVACMEIRLEYNVEVAHHVDIYINLPNADAETDSGCEEYYDFISTLPASHGSRPGEEVTSGFGNTSVTFTTRPILRERLQALELSEAPSLVVTLVPRAHNISSAYLSLLSASIVVATHYYISTI